MTIETKGTNELEITFVKDDKLTLYGTEVNSRLLLGTAQYPSPHILQQAINQSGCDIITVSVRRESSSDQEGQRFWSVLKSTNTHILPNTAGCRSVKEAVTTAQMARELFETDWIKLEVIGNDDNLQPNVFALVEAAVELTRLGFKVFPYTTDDIVVGERLLEAGCEVLMPWASPIGSARGLQNPFALEAMRAYFPDTPLIVDAGLGLPSHATQALELGFDAVLLNTAVAKSGKPVEMATAFAKAVEAGRLSYLADPIEKREMAAPSTPVAGTPFWID